MNTLSELSETINRDQLQIGMIVRIEDQTDRIRGNLIEGTIKEILTKANQHPHGIKVKLDDGKIGRVKEILDSIHAVNLIKQRPETQQLSENDLPKTETENVEFKASFKLDLNRFEKGDCIKVQNKDVEKEVSITISAMANVNGGVLYIGVRDDGEVIGLANDYEISKNPNDDQFQIRIWQSIQKYINNMTYASKLRITLREIDNKKICIVEIPSAVEPIFVHDNGTQESYVRMGPKSEKFTPLDFMKYCKERFPK